MATEEDHAWGSLRNTSDRQHKYGDNSNEKVKVYKANNIKNYGLPNSGNIIS